jgi:sec-independent protein translocase protein TatB
VLSADRRRRCAGRLARLVYAVLGGFAAVWAVPLLEGSPLNLFGLSPGELLLILIVAMIVIGPEKLPETAASIGKWIREFRRVTNELTQQFAEDNPFTEIQRALSFTDEPVASSAATYTPIQTTPASDHVAVVESSAAIAQPAPATVTPPRRSDYFERPAYYLAVDDSWTHGGLTGYSGSHSKNGIATPPPIADEWAHGVAIPPPPRPVEDVGATVASIDDQPAETDNETAPSTEPMADLSVTATDNAATEPVASAVSAEPGPQLESATAVARPEVVEATNVAAEESTAESVEVAIEPAPPRANGVGHHLESTANQPVESPSTTSEPEVVGATAGVTEERLP